VGWYEGQMRRRLGVLVLSGVLLFGTTSCGGPKVADIGPRLQQDLQALLGSVADDVGLKGSQPTVKQDAGTDVPCGDGKAKRVFEATLPVRTSADLDNTLQLADNAVLANVRGYTIKTPANNDDLVRREMTLRADDYPATLAVVVTAAPVPTLTLSGETDCLKAG
jgi:hypothetical protein